MPTILRNNKVLWTLQILLAALYLFAGGFKIVAAPEQMRRVAGRSDSVAEHGCVSCG